jgi:hypothetical protein
VNSRHDDGSELGILLIVLVALAATIGFLIVTDSEGEEPIPLPAAPTTVTP